MPSFLSRLFFTDIDTDTLEADKDNLEEEFVECLVKEETTFIWTTSTPSKEKNIQKQVVKLY